MDYKPHNRWKAPLSPNRCAASVHDAGRSVGHHQCNFKPGHGKDGRYCKKHALSTEEATKKGWLVPLRFRIHQVEEVGVVRETPKTATIIHAEGTRETMHKGKYYHLYGSEREAWEFVLDRATKRREVALQDAKNLMEVIRKAKGILKSYT